MGTLPVPDDALYEAADLIALAVSVREALEAGQKGQAAAALRGRQYEKVAGETGMTQIGTLVDAELERLRR